MFLHDTPEGWAGVKPTPALQAALQATLSNRNDMLGRRQYSRSVVSSSVVRVVMAYIVLAALVIWLTALAWW